MSYARELLDTYPGNINADAGVLATAIDALSDCAQACVACADADLGEQDVAAMVACIGLCWDCADVCTATMRVVSRPTASAVSITTPLLEACIAVCTGCGDECARHARHHEHYRICQEACRRCEQACRELRGALKT
jgi:hypothetical protein